MLAASERRLREEEKGREEGKKNERWGFTMQADTQQTGKTMVVHSAHPDSTASVDKARQ